MYACIDLSFAAEHHLHALLNQLIERDNLARVWKDVIMPIVLKISEKVSEFYLPGFYFIYYQRRQQEWEKKAGISVTVLDLL